MLKWVGRILYVFFVLLIIGFVEVMSGGVKGIQRGLYATENIVDKFERGDDPLSYLPYYSAALETYFSKTPILNKDNESNYTNSNSSILDDYKIDLSFYPFISTIKDDKHNIWFDGFYIVVNSASDKISYLRVEVLQAYNSLDEDQSNTLYLENESYLNIFLESDGFFLNERVPGTTYLINSLFYNAEQTINAELEKEGKEVETYDTAEYNIKAIDIYVYPKLDEDEEIDEDKDYGILALRLTDGDIDLLGSPLVTLNNLNLLADDMNISKHLKGKTPTEEEIDLYNLDTTYHPVNYSKYNYVYFIVYPIYFVLILVIPYFMFFHKKVMKAYRDKKGIKDPNMVQLENKKTEEQIFSDYEPPKDDKK